MQSVRWITTTLLLGGLVGLPACRSCSQGPPPRQPQPLQGKLPPAPAARAGLPTAPPEPPHCAVVAALEVLEGHAPLRLNMAAEGACTDGPSHFEWDFGDGSPKVQQQSPQHIYEKPGEYTAHVTINDGEGRTDFDEVVVTVLP